MIGFPLALPSYIGQLQGAIPSATSSILRKPASLYCAGTFAFRMNLRHSRTSINVFHLWSSTDSQFMLLR